MSRDDIQKLLGGYATGSLTPDEQEALFTAALDDQELFDALAREQSLRDLLRDPAARARVLASLDRHRTPWWRVVWLATAGVAALSIIAVMVVRWQRPAPPVQMAIVQQPAAALPAAPAAPPAVAEEAPRKERESRPVMPRRQLDAPVQLAKKTPAPAKETDAVTFDDKKAASAEKAKDAEQQAGLSQPALQQDALQQQAKQQQAGAPQAVAPQAIAPQAAQQQQFAAPARNTVEVSPSAPQARAANARALFYGGQRDDATNRGVKWNVLQRQPDGEYAIADPQALRSGDVVKLRFESNAAGYLSLSSGGRPLVANQKLERLQAFDSEAVTLEGAGSKQFSATFSPQVSAGIAGAVSQATVKTKADKRERSHEADNQVAGSSAQPVSFTITLTYK